MESGVELELDGREGGAAEWKWVVLVYDGAGMGEAIMVGIE